MNQFFRILFSLYLALFIALGNTVAFGGIVDPSKLPPAWAYDGGPDINDPMQKELIDIVADMPFLPGISVELMDGQKFRLDFGPVMWRMLLQKNAIKILFIGQDATHIAEAAGRTATAGFGGRAQDLARHCGVGCSAGFTNASVDTIYGQYNVFQTPYVVKDKDGTAQIRYSGYVDNNLWLMMNDPNSPMVKWRNRFLDWIIRNNKESLRVIVLFGGAARDAGGTFIESKGGVVGTRIPAEEMANIQLPILDVVNAGGNAEIAVPVNREGKDLYVELAGKPLDYGKSPDQGKTFPDQIAAQKALVKDTAASISKMIFTEAGPYKNGLIHPGQLGGYNLDQIYINGSKTPTRSLQGLPLSDGSVMGNILVREFPHPTALSKMAPDQASKTVGAALDKLRPYMEKGWTIEPDPGYSSPFLDGEPYKYGRADIGPEYYSFGTTKARMVSVSSAIRLKPNIISFGSRDRGDFDKATLDAMTKAMPVTMPDPRQMYTARPRTPETRYIFDFGPSEEFARMMKVNLNFSEIYKPKKGMTWKDNGIDAFNIKTHPDLGDFGHYRGKFENPKIVILADPDGLDELISDRAMTGTRGQYLHKLMEELGVGDDYLVIRTVPFGMDEATPEEWATVLKQTSDYREKLITSVLQKSKSTILLLTDGVNAKGEMARIVKKMGNVKIPVVNIQKQGLGNNSGIVEAGKQITNDRKFSGQLADIPRSHLTYYARMWIGTSGDRVLGTKDKAKGSVVAEVAPAWSYEQKVVLDPESEKADQAILKRLKDNGYMLPGEKVADWFKRTGNDGKISWAMKATSSCTTKLAGLINPLR